MKRHRGGFRQPYRPRQRGTGRRVSTTALRRAGIIIPAIAPAQRGYLRVGGFYGRYANGGEMKFHDVDFDDGVIDQAGTVEDSINKIAQGTTESERVGRKCVIKSIMWRYLVSIPEQDATGTPGNGETVRLIMFVDKQCNGAAATPALILASTDFQSFNNLANSGRFRTLFDKTITMNYMGLASDGAAVVSQAEVVRNGTFFKKCNIPLEFDKSFTDGRITTIRSNNIGILAISSVGIGGVFSKIRLRFSDA